MKSFQGSSPIREFETALGQLTIYRVFLKKRKLELKVYLGIGKKIHEDFFQQPAIQAVLDEVGVPLIVVDLETETIIQWIE
ncbi:MAG: element excision factor XisH family protein [Cyanobacteria bacterium P01_G01_bin.54]